MTKKVSANIVISREVADSVPTGLFSDLMATLLKAQQEYDSASSERKAEIDAQRLSEQEAFKVEESKRKAAWISERIDVINETYGWDYNSVVKAWAEYEYESWE